MKLAKKAFDKVKIDPPNNPKNLNCFLFCDVLFKHDDNYTHRI